MTQQQEKPRKRRRKKASDRKDSPTPPEQGLPGGIETLLESPHRKELPPIPRKGRRSILIDLVIHAPSLYSRMMLLIQQGVYFHVAAECIGVNENTFHDWATRGHRDLQAKEDTFYSRFFLDIRRSVAIARADCEIEIKKKDPKKWLVSGPGKLFGTQWVKENPLLPTEEEEPDTIEAVLTTQAKLIANKEEEQVKEGETVLVTTENDQEEAMRVLEQAGLVSFSDSYKEAMNNQNNPGKLNQSDNNDE